MRRSTILLAILFTVLLVGAATAPALAAGFEVAETSGRQLGNAFSGKAAEANDASTVFFNPAGMTRLEGIHAVAALDLLLPGGRFVNQGSMNLGLRTPLMGSSSGNPGDPTFLPSVYICADLPKGFSVGLGLNAPFGLKTEYGEQWIGRYHALKSELVVMNVNPCAAYQVLDNLSVGAGVNYSMAEAELSNAVDFGSILAGSGAFTPQQLGALGIAPEQNDGKAVVDSDVDDGWGFNLGILWEVSEKTRIGLSYRSKISHELTGDATFTQPANVMASGFSAATGLFTDTTGTARLVLPEQVYLSAYHELNDQWALLADVTWTRWSRFEELRVTFGNPVQPDSVQEQDWDDVFRFSLGTIYRPDPAWSVRAGVAYDQSPTKDKHRSPRIPTNDRIWIAFGVGVQVSENVAVDLSYAHIFIMDADMDQVTATGQRLLGEFRGFANIFGIQFTMNF